MVWTCVSNGIKEPGENNWRGRRLWKLRSTKVSVAMWTVKKYKEGN